MRRVWPLAQRITVPFFGLALVFAVGFLAVRAADEDDRIAAKVTAQVSAEVKRIAAEQERATTASCIKWRSDALADLTPRSTQVVRDLVRTAAAAYDLIDCELGPLGPLPSRCPDDAGPPQPPACIDPEAYRAAPDPTPTN